MKDFFNNGNEIRDILRKSSRALCAPSEREVVVKQKNFQSTLDKLNKSDYRVIGTSYGSGPKRIWFIKRGSVI